ncbi:androgen-induced gene 1 protein-like isoform X3 [Cimex lectularius]|uniref:Uncharacterized protein n=1 Tax=Cimex lectularius TaxID=79782 RepID=A0A8I6SBL6_CIMLE|nr:androgen-induced gene 1 protein-like isoform X3 [Cimex lectularius]
MYRDITKPQQDFYTRFAYSLKYITMLNALIQSIYFLIALIVDIMISCSYTMDAPPRCLMVRSFLRSAIIIPVGLYTFVTFWVLTWYDDALFEDYGQDWSRHFLYTSNAIFLLLDVIFCKGKSSGMLVTLLVINIPSILYFVWLHVIYHFTEVWAVTFMSHLTLLERLIMYIVHIFGLYVYYAIGKILNDILWDEEFVLRIPVLRNFVSPPPRFIYGHPSKDSTTFGKVLSRTEILYVDRPVNKQKTQPTQPTSSSKK